MDDKPKLRVISGGGPAPPHYEHAINVAFAQLAIIVCRALMGVHDNADDPLPQRCLDFVNAYEAYQKGTGDERGYPLSTIDLNEKGKALLAELVRLLETHPELQP